MYLFVGSMFYHLYNQTSYQALADLRQGLTLVHFSAQREHFLSHVLGCFAGFSDKIGSG
jgi:hypothetical protein